MFCGSVTFSVGQVYGLKKKKRSVTGGSVLLACDAASLDFRHSDTTEWSHFKGSKCPRRMNINQWRGVPIMQCTCTILSSVACPVLLYFSTLSHKRHDFRNS